jgi:hypothetical protein
MRRSVRPIGFALASTMPAISTLRRGSASGHLEKTVTGRIVAV